MVAAEDSRLPELEESIRLRRATLQHLESESIHRADALKGLGDSLIAFWDVSRSDAVLEEAIHVYEEILQLYTKADEGRAQALGDLGDALWRFCLDHNTDMTRSDQYLELLRETLQLRPPGDPLRDQALHNLARALNSLRYSRGLGGSEVLLESMSLNREALQLRPLGHPNRAWSLNNLALDLWTHYEHTGDVQLLTEVIRLNREALHLTPTDSPHHNASLANLATALKSKFQCSGELKLLTEAIRLRREALRLCPPGHPQRHFALNNLGSTLHASFDSHGGFELLAEALTLHREALELRPVGHPLRHTTLGNLAQLLLINFSHQGGAKVLSEAIARHREALSLLHDAHPDYAEALSNLAHSLLVAHRERFNLSVLAEAISLLQTALEIQPVGHALQDEWLHTLGDALQDRFEAEHDIPTLNQAISFHTQALRLRPHGHSRRIRSLESLADLHQKAESPVWSEIFALYNEALAICPAGYPARAKLLSGKSRCFLSPESPFFDIERGLSCLSEGYGDNSSHVNQRLKYAASDLHCVEEALCYWASKGCDPSALTNCDDHALDIYAQVVGLLPCAANFGLNLSTRLQATSGSDRLGRNAVARALILGRISQAVEMLEEGRGVFWSQALRMRATGFDGVPDEDCVELTQLLRSLEHAARRAERADQSPTERERDLEVRRQLNEKAEALIVKIRGYPGLERFLLSPSFDALMAALPNGFVVIVNTSQLGHHALILHRTTGLKTSFAIQAPRTGFNSSHLRSQLPRDAKGKSDGKSRAMRLDQGNVESLNVVLAQLWTSIGRPVIHATQLSKATGRVRPRLWWCVTGELGFLPVHAAGIYREAEPICIADYAVSSYIPTLHLLIKATNNWKPIPRSHLTGLIICESSSHNVESTYLPQAADEVSIVRNVFASAQAEVLNTPSDHTSLSDMRLLLEKTPAHVLHMACHGVHNEDPLKSALVLHDGRLTIEDIMHLSLPRAVLAYLSACHTAKGDQNAPDQAVHLAASMLFCGFRSVIGTMWLMHDEDGPIVAQHIYEDLFGKEHLELDDVPYALDRTMQALRHAGVPAQRWASFMHMGG